MDLQEQIEKRITEANRKRIALKAKNVVQKFGKRTNPSYMDSGETFYDTNWELGASLLKITYFEDALNNPGILFIFWNGRPVFEFREKILSYIPGKEWENKLDELYLPIGKLNDKEGRNNDKELREKFGLLENEDDSEEEALGRTVPAEHFVATLAKNVDNDKLLDFEFRDFVRNTLPIVIYPDYKN